MLFSLLSDGLVELVFAVDICHDGCLAADPGVGIWQLVVVVPARVCRHVADVDLRPVGASQITA